MIDLRRLPQRSGGIFLTDAGIETTLTFRDGFDLPHFAAFHLLRDEQGTQALRDYYRRHAEIARKNGAASSWKAPPGGRAPTGATCLAIP